MDRVKPIIITNDETGEEYTLEFSMETVKMAENSGFTREDFQEKLMTRVPELFYYAFKMHHPTMKKKDTDKILFDDLGGINEAMSVRLADLYNAPYMYLINEEGAPKNSKVKVVL